MGKRLCKKKHGFFVLRSVAMGRLIFGNGLVVHEPRLSYET